MKAPKIVKYALAGLLLATVGAQIVKCQTIDDKVNKAASGRSVRVTVTDDFHKTPLDSAIVRFVNQGDTSISYQDTTDHTGVVQWDSFYTDVPNKPDMPLEFKLNQNYPNPFNPSTAIPFNLERYSDVNLSIYNIGGQLVKTLVDGNLASGDHEYIWQGMNDQGQGVAVYHKSTNEWEGYPAVHYPTEGPIYNILADSANVWIGTGDGVLKLIKDEKRFRQFTEDDGLLANSVYWILLDGDFVWFGTDLGLSRFYWNAPHRID